LSGQFPGSLSAHGNVFPFQEQFQFFVNGQRIPFSRFWHPDQPAWHWGVGGQNSLHVPFPASSPGFSLGSSCCIPDARCFKIQGGHVVENDRHRTNGLSSVLVDNRFHLLLG